MSLDPRWATCALCPRLCRTACPVATGSGREAAVPSFLAEILGSWERGRVDPGLAREAATLCTDCGACQAFCHLHRPLPDALRAARARLVDPPAMAPLAPLEGQGEWIAIEADPRPLAQAVADWLGEPVIRWPTSDRLGVGAVEHPRWEERAAALRARVGARKVVLVDGGVARALAAAGIGFRWLHELDPSLPTGHGSCQAGGERPLACCGGAGPLPAHHPEDAARVATLWAARAEHREVADARCRAHLRAAGVEASDPLDALLARGRTDAGGAP